MKGRPVAGILLQPLSPGQAVQPLFQQDLETTQLLLYRLQADGCRWTLSSCPGLHETCGRRGTVTCLRMGQSLPNPGFVIIGCRHHLNTRIFPAIGEDDRIRPQRLAHLLQNAAHIGPMESFDLHSHLFL